MHSRANLYLQKAHGRQRALNLSTTLTAEEKDKIKPLLKAEYMSSDESDVEMERHQDEVGSSDEESLSNNNHQEGQQRKKLIRHRLTWRSREVQLTFESLDRKLARRRSDKAKAMCLEVTYGSDSSRAAPDNCPEWAIELFS